MSKQEVRGPIEGVVELRPALADVNKSSSLPRLSNQVHCLGGSTKSRVTFSQKLHTEFMEKNNFETPLIQFLNYSYFLSTF